VLKDTKMPKPTRIPTPEDLWGDCKVDGWDDHHTYRIPTPEDLWGDCKVDGWDDHHTFLWKLWLMGIAAILIFADQTVIDRVAEVIRSTTTKARSGELTAEEAVWAISPMVLISSEEWEIIKGNARKQGHIAEKFFLSDDPIAGNN
jgi:hypothetical protein